MSEEIKIYVADLAAYNAGKLHGVWINATDDVDDIWNQINKMLKQGPIENAEEFAVHDCVGFAGYDLGEYEDIQTVHEIACFIEAYPDFAGEFLNYFSDLEEAQKMTEENYYGCYKSVADYAQELTEETTQIPDHLMFYIDYEKMGRDMELSGDIFTIEIGYEEVHIFENY